MNLGLNPSTPANFLFGCLSTGRKQRSERCNRGPNPRARTKIMMKSDWIIIAALLAFDIGIPLWGYLGSRKYQRWYNQQPEDMKKKIDEAWEKAGEDEGFYY